MKNKVSVIMMIFAFSVLCFPIFLCKDTAFSEDVQKGGIKVEVVDIDGEKIEGAKVFVCEISKCFLTNKFGQTQNIFLDVLPDSRYIEVCKKDFGEVSLIVTKEGFCPTAVFFVAVRNGLVRTGPRVCLREGCEQRYVIDQLDESWVAQFFEKFGEKGSVRA